MTPRREFGLAIVACVLGAGLTLLALRQGWALVGFHAPAPLPSGSVPVTGQALLPAVSALALAALACLAAVIATRGLARRLAGVVMAGLGAWIVVAVSAPLHAAGVIAAAAGSASPAGLAGSLPAGNSTISGNAPSSGGGLPVIGTVTRVMLSGAPWRAAAVAGAVVVIAAGLVTAWRGPRWPVMSARFDRPGPRAPVAATGPPHDGTRPTAGIRPLTASAQPPVAGIQPPAGGTQPLSGGVQPLSGGSQPPAGGTQPQAGGGQPLSGGSQPPADEAQPLSGGVQPLSGGVRPLAGGAGEPGQPAPDGGPVEQAEPAAASGLGRQHPDGDAAALWEALDRGVDLTDTSDLVSTTDLPEATDPPSPAGPRDNPGGNPAGRTAPATIGGAGHSIRGDSGSA